MSTDDKKQDQKDKAVKVTKSKEPVVSKKPEVKKDAKKAEAKKTEAKKPEVSATSPKKVVESSSELKHVLSGEVVSVKMDKTIVVLMERKVKHL